MSGVTTRATKRRASPTHHLPLGLPRRRRYQSRERETPVCYSANTEASGISLLASAEAGIADLEVMVVASSAAVLQREVPTVCSVRTHLSALHGRCMKLKYRKSKKILDLQRALIADSDGDRPLHMAVVHRDAVLVRQICGMLHSIKASLDYSNYMRQTPLHLAVILREPLLVEVLIDEGCTLTPRDSRGNTPLHLAAGHPGPECVEAILRCSPDQSKVVLDERNYEGKSSLHIAVTSSNAETVRALASAGCNVNIGDGKSGRSALMHAVYDRNIAMVRLLLQCGASPDAQDYAGNTAHTAAAETDESVADLLAYWGSKLRR